MPELRLERALLRSSPHRLSTESIARVMWSVVAALLPACLAACWYFGWRALAVILGCAVLCVLFEYLLLRFRVGAKQALRTSLDGSAVVTGVLLALNLPASSPWWLVIVGSLVAMLLGKHLFGGLGYNIFNPALVARVFLLLSFPAEMTSWIAPGTGAAFLKVDAVTAATPLGIIKADGLAAYLAQAAQQGQGLWQLFVGNVAGSLGEVSGLALLIGAALLFWRRYITWQIPLTYVATVFVVTGVLYLVNPGYYASPVLHVVSGGLILGAFFMATDMVTSPVSGKGMVIFGIGCGLLTAVIRLFGSFPEGVSFAILVMNGLTPLIDRYTRPVKFGAERLPEGLGKGVASA